MSLTSVVFGLGLLLLGACFVGQPWWSRSEGAACGSDQTPSLSGLSGLAGQRDATYAALSELELDHRAGKVNDGDYAVVRAQLMSEAVHTLQRMDAADDQIEREIQSVVRQRRSENPNPTLSANERGGDLCPACGKHISADARFCSGCGTSLALACPACGRAVGSGDLFCGRCGTALASTAAA
jgi:hypothetical protein